MLRSLGGCSGARPAVCRGGRGEAQSDLQPTDCAAGRHDRARRRGGKRNVRGAATDLSRVARGLRPRPDQDRGTGHTREVRRATDLAIRGAGRPRRRLHRRNLVQGFRDRQVGERARRHQSAPDDRRCRRTRSVSRPVRPAVEVAALASSDDGRRSRSWRRRLGMATRRVRSRSRASYRRPSLRRRRPRVPAAAEVEGAGVGARRAVGLESRESSVAPPATAPEVAALPASAAERPPPNISLIRSRRLMRQAYRPVWSRSLKAGPAPRRCSNSY